MIPCFVYAKTLHNRMNQESKTRLKFAFRSGMSSASDLRGAIDAGVPVGVVAQRLTTRSLVLGLPNYLRAGGAVFVDSGAFSELTTGAEPDWDKVISCYETLLLMSDNVERLYVVAPDKVGDQLASLARLGKYKRRIIQLAQSGVKVIVPIQAGDLSAADVLDTIRLILEGAPFVIGIPSNKEALSIEECATLHHDAFHILGRVQVDQLQQARIDALMSASPKAELTADASWIRSRLRDVSIKTGLVAAERQNKSFFSIDRPRAEAITSLMVADKNWGLV